LLQVNVLNPKHELMNTTTLIIHPKDPSTVFLNKVYDSITEKQVIQGGLTKKQVLTQIEIHERILMMGHGSPSGLFAIGQFPRTSSYIIDNEMVSILKKKRNNVFIWCYAEKFIEALNLPGFATGMFISEVGEAFYCGLKGIDQKTVDESNTIFVNEISKTINLDSEGIYENIINGDYKLLAETNPVAKYNYDRMYYS
jgi:hypothetical protein